VEEYPESEKTVYYHRFWSVSVAAVFVLDPTRKGNHAAACTTWVVPPIEFRIAFPTIWNGCTRRNIRIVPSPFLCRFVRDIEWIFLVVSLWI